MGADGNRHFQHQLGVDDYLTEQLPFSLFIILPKELFLLKGKVCRP